jgi:hypothetical protein
MRKGTVIQVFGRFFAGLMDMYMERWYKVNSDYANEPFKIVGVSPFSIIGTPDPELQKYAECERTNTRVKADVRKNFDRICEKSYCDYFVFDNTNSIIGQWQINGQFYSLMGGEKTDFMDDYYNNNGVVKKNYIRPVEEGFSERFQYQYNLFIDAVLRHYDAEHIILIRSHVPRFRSDNGNIVKTKHMEKMRVFLQTLDDYFAERVKCAVLDTPASFFESKENASGHPFKGGQEDLRITLERAVIAEIKNPSAPHGIANSMFFRNLRADVLKKHSQFFLGKADDDTLKKELYSLSAFWGTAGTKILADYIADGGSDLALVANYFKYIDYTFDDIAALFFLHENTEDKSVFANIADEILANKQGVAYLQNKKIFERNLRTLCDYAYCQIRLDDVKFEDKIILRFDTKHFLEISANGFCVFDTTAKQKWDWKKFVESNFTCGIEHINDALESWEMYFERGRHKLTAPFVLRFESEADFAQSLYWADFADILSNEHYVVAIGDSVALPLEYAVKNDFEFFFDPNSRIVKSQSGMADQIFYYAYLKRICEDAGIENLYINDLYNHVKNISPIAMSSDLLKLLPCDNKNKSFVNIFSHKLINRFLIVSTAHKVHHPWLLSSCFYKLGLSETVIVSHIGILGIQNENFNHTIRLDYPILFYDDSSLSQAKKWIGNACGYIPLSVILHKGWSDVSFDYQKQFFEDNFTFPPFADDELDIKNREIAEQMLSTDAVCVHIRRGDFFTLGFMAGARREDSYYDKQLKRLWELPGYDNKHLFVFSDDTEYCKKYAKSIGLGIADNNITYIDHNHHYNSFRDMHLMTLGKLIVVSSSGFNQCAALISKRVEWFVGKSVPIFDQSIQCSRTLWHRGEPDRLN